jgi:hypothetical protein
MRGVGRGTSSEDSEAIMRCISYEHIFYNISIRFIEQIYITETLTKAKDMAGNMNTKPRIISLDVGHDE